GDAAGIAAALGIRESERPHRMLFVGDHPLFDEPRDPRVVFHLEPFALMRSALELARLVLHLREVGGGSLAGGVGAVMQPRRPWWHRLWGTPTHLAGQPITRCIAGVGEVVLVRRPEGCPVIGFARLPEAGAVPTLHSFVPADLLALVEME